MLQVFKEITERVDSMQLRERAMLLLAGTAVLFFLIDTFGLQPTFKQQKQEKTTINELEQQLHVLRERSGLLSAHTGKDPLLWRVQLQKELSGLENRLQKELGGLLAPDQAIQVLEQVLTQEQGLKLLEVDAVSTPLSTMELAEEANRLTTSIGRYGLQLQLEGSYLAILSYLLALEALPWKFFWESVDFEVIEYPNARVTLDIYTLGLLEG